MEALNFIVGILPDLAKATVVTIQLAAGGLLIGLVLGIPSSLFKLYGKGLPRFLAICYIEFFRGTPLLIQLFLIYYALPGMGLNISRMHAAWLALGINSGAYQAEYFRGAFEAVTEGQMTAARAAGMTKFQAVFHVVLPQAVRLVIPPWSNECIYLIQYTSAAFAIAIPELMATAKTIVSWTYKPIEVFMAVAVIYMVLLSGLTYILKKLELRFKIPGFGGSGIPSP